MMDLRVRIVWLGYSDFSDSPENTGLGSRGPQPNLLSSSGRNALTACCLVTHARIHWTKVL